MAKDRTKSDNASREEWIPTKKQEALLNVLLDPHFRLGSTITDICKLAECSREYYYTQFNDPEFSGFYRKTVIGAIKQKAGKLVNIGMQNAELGGKEGFGYWKELMKMGELTESDNPKLEVTGELVIRFSDPEEAEDEEED